MSVVAWDGRSLAADRQAVEAAERFCIHCGFGVDEAVPTEREMFSGERG